MKRGDIVTVATGGGFGGKPRPALVVQSDAFLSLSTAIVIPFTSELAEAAGSLRIRVEPDATNGLDRTSELMVHAPITVRASAIGGHVGRLPAEVMTRVEQALLLVLGFGG